MESGPRKSKMYVVEGRPWKQAIITVLEPRSPYRPWRADEFDRIQDGDRVVAVIDTDPVSVLATVGFVGADGDVHNTLAGIERFELGGSPALFELDTLNMVSTVHLPASARSGGLADVLCTSAVVDPVLTRRMGGDSLLVYWCRRAGREGVRQRRQETGAEAGPPPVSVLPLTAARRRPAH